MIHGCMIIDKKRGIPLVKRFYSDIGTKTDLFSSFISAMWQFAEKEIGLKKGLKILRMGGYKWTYLSYNDLLFVIISDPSERDSWVKAQLEYIKVEFFKAYPELEENANKILQNWDGDLSQWKPFEGTIDELLLSWEKIPKVAASVRMMDVLEVFQKLVMAIFPNLSPWKKKEAIEYITELAKKEKLDIIVTDIGVDLLSINPINSTYSKVKRVSKLIFGKLFDDYVESINNYDKLIAQLHSNIYPIIKEEWKRIRTYGLDKFLIPLILV